MMKTILKKIVLCLPAPWARSIKEAFLQLKNRWQLAGAYGYDKDLYKTHSGLLDQQRKGVIEAEIIKAYHRIEKGLALSAPRPGFGVDAVERVLTYTQLFLRAYGPNITTRRAMNTLHEYVAFNQSKNHNTDWLLPRLSALASANAVNDSAGGTLLVTRESIIRATSINFAEFVKQRFSIRQFSNEPVSDSAIRHAVELAKKSPSVCNRESGCVYVATSAAQKQALLALQNGNRGFGEQADRVLVITSRLDAFLTVGERYQCWIDGGLFAMSLIYALHSQGIGSCCLNWSVEPEADQAIRKVQGIPADHAIIMLLAIGNIPAELRVAQSPRRPIEEVLHFI